MKQFTIMFVILCLSLPLMAARKALVIGNGAYTSAPLKNPVNDATDVAAALEKLGFAVTLKTNSDLQTMETSINSFAGGLTSSDDVIFYYSGHGVQVRGDNWLIPVQAEINNEYDCVNRCFSASTAMGLFSTAHINVFILDACRDNPFKGLRSASKGLAPMQTPEDAQYMIVYATKGGSVAMDNIPGGNGRNSPFTQSLLKYLSAPDEEITPLFKKIGGDVYNSTEKKQDPWISSNLKDDFFLSTNIFSLEANSNEIHPGQTGQAMTDMFGTLEFTIDLEPNIKNEYKLFLFWELVNHFGYQIPNVVNNFQGKPANLIINPNQIVEGVDGIIYDGSVLRINRNSMMKWYKEIYKKDMPKDYRPGLRGNLTGWKTVMMPRSGEFFAYRFTTE